MSPLIDFHSHFFSLPFFKALAGQSDLPGSVEEKISNVAGFAKIEVPSGVLDEHLARWLGEMDTYGIAHLVSFASLPEEVDTVSEAAGLADGRLTPFALVNPCADGAGDRTRELFERGFRGVLLFPAMHRYNLRGEEAAAVFGAVEEHGGVAVVHCGVLQVKLRDLFGLPRGYDINKANPTSLVPAANRFPGARFVVPHFGAGYLRETLMLGAMCENVFVDTSSSNGWVATQPEKLSLIDVFDRTLGVFGSDRVLFGTDSSVFPRGWRHDLYTLQREALGALGVSEADRARIFGRNAAHILGLEL